jgi:glycosyltransferase involved in cell wall biosynthesis
MKILMVLSKDFIVDPRVYREAKSLVEEGNQVTVISWDRTHKHEHNRVIEGINVIFLYNTKGMNLLPNDILRNPFWWRAAYKKGIQLYQNGFTFDVVHCHDLDTLQTGVWLKRKLGVKLIYDAHEIFVYMIERSAPKVVVRYANRMERKLLKEVDYVITVDDGYAEYFRHITTKPLAIVRNCKDLIGEYKPPSQHIFTLTYIGTLNRSRFFPQMLHVIGKIQNVQFIIIAKKENILYNEVKELAQTYKNIKFLDPIPTSQVLSVTQEGHVVVCLFDPTKKLNRIGSPNKLFEAMVTGRPIIVTKGTHAGDIVEREQCGLSVDYSEEGLEKAVLLLRDNPALCEQLGRNGLKAAQSEFNWSKQEEQLHSVYQQVNAA